MFWTRKRLPYEPKDVIYQHDWQNDGSLDNGEWAFFLFLQSLKLLVCKVVESLAEV